MKWSDLRSMFGMGRLMQGRTAFVIAHRLSTISITVDDLAGLPLFCSGHSWKNDIPRWAKDRMDDLHLEGSFGLVYNASVFAKEHLGYLLSFDKLVDTSPESGMVFRPLTPKLETNLYLVWKKYQTFSPIAERFLKQIKKSFGQKQTSGS